MHDHGLSWLALAGLGAFHGLNPAMGWLFAVALGLHRQSRRVVWLSLVPIALGHALSVFLVVAGVVLFHRTFQSEWIARVVGVLLIGWAAWHWKYGHRRRVRVGMQTGMAGLALWSFLMATAHGAGLMLAPLVLPHGGAGPSWGHALAAVAVHSGAMLAVTGAVAVIVYEWAGLAILRTGWVNLDLVWSVALVAAGIVLLL